MAAPVRCRCRPPPRTDVSPAVAEQPKWCQTRVLRNATCENFPYWYRDRTGRIRLRGWPNCGGASHEDLPLSWLRSRNPFADCASGRLAGRRRRTGIGPPPALAHVVLGTPDHAQPEPKVVLVSGRRLHQLDQDAAGIPRVDEVDPGVRCPRGRMWSKPRALRIKPLGQLLEIADAVGQLLNARAALVENSRSPTNRRSEPAAGLGVPTRARARRHRLADALVLVELFVGRDRAEVVVVPRDRRVDLRPRRRRGRFPSPERSPERRHQPARSHDVKVT